MRTTIDLPDSLLGKVRKVAAKRRTSLRQLAIEGLQTVVDRDRIDTQFRLRDASFGHGGTVEGVDTNDWAKLRDLAYEGRGT